MTRARLRVEEHDTVESLERLRHEWNDLADRCPWATPFHTPAWLIPWWRYLGAGRLAVLTVRHDDRLVGLAPLFQPEPEGSRRLAMLGTGISDYGGVLLHPPVAADAWASLLAHLTTTSTLEWEACEMAELSPCSPLLQLPLPPGLRASRAPASICPVVPGAESLNALIARLPGRARRHLANSARRLARAGGARLVRADGSSLGVLMDALFTLHHLRWKERGEPGVLADPRLRPFHDEAAAAFLRSDALRLYGLEMRGAVVAVLYGFAHGGRTCLYLQAMHPAWSAAAPGVALVRHAIGAAVAEGAMEVDMLRGQEPYKYTWGARDRWNIRLEIRRAPASDQAASGQSSPAREGAPRSPQRAPS